MSVKFGKNAVSLGLLPFVPKWPSPEMPEWANTVARRMQGMGVVGSQIKKVIREMELTRRRNSRQSFQEKDIDKWFESILRGGLT